MNRLHNLRKTNNLNLLSENGMILVSILGIMIFLSIMLVGMFGLAGSNLSRSKSRLYLLQAQYAAESAADEAIARLNSGNEAYTGTSSDIQVLDAANYRSVYSVSVAPGIDNKEKIITAIGKIYAPKNATTAEYERKIQITAQRSSTTTALSAVSRNILAIDSAVKSFTAKDVYVNGYIITAKNSTNFIAENITVAGKNTGATNCSIGGSGTLVKPASFTTPGQTKTNITTTFNNCLNPQNTSNTDFNVKANQNTVGTVQSTYLPWTQMMDTSYTSATNNCTDWTSSSTTKNIPGVTGSKKTHYPDTGSSTVSSCGSNGSVSLGTARYNLNANAHIRANLCAATACSPSFYNPDSSIKYLFVEGTVNFDSLQTVSGSGPIVLVVYGSDPSSKTSVCPYGGAAYIGNGGSTNARSLYLLATNGVCLDKTKFSSNPALGGMSGKNLYISTNSGSPFDLELNSSFPVGQIPLDVTWRAVRYLRL